jgi:Ca2+-binding EF-hand superfamily protein
VPFKNKQKEKNSDHHIMSGTVREQNLIAAFRAFDSEGTGKIPTQALVTILKGIGNALRPDEVKEFIADADQNGFVEYESYVKNVIFSC